MINPTALKAEHVDIHKRVENLIENASSGGRIGEF